MPELPEVETVRRELEPWLTSRTIKTARRADAPPGPKYAHLERADGQRIEAGQVILSGSFIRPVECPSGSEIHADFGDFGSVEVGFA